MAINHLLSFFALAIGAGVATQAAAQPGAVVAPPAPAATPAPQTHDWSTVSHINGTPVKVGESNMFLRPNPKFMVGVNPLALVFKVADISAWATVSNNFAVHAHGMFLFDEYNTGARFALSTPLYLKRVYQGLYVEPGILLDSLDSSDTRVGLEVLLGHQSLWDSGFSFAYAAGPVRYLDSPECSDGYYCGDLEFGFAGYMQVGYAWR